MRFDPFSDSCWAFWIFSSVRGFHRRKKTLASWRWSFWDGIFISLALNVIKYQLGWKGLEMGENRVRRGPGYLTSDNEGSKLGDCHDRRWWSHWAINRLLGVLKEWLQCLVRHFYIYCAPFSTHGALLGKIWSSDITSRLVKYNFSLVGHTSRKHKRLTWDCNRDGRSVPVLRQRVSLTWLLI